MIFLGHLALSVALADASDSDRAASVAGSILPDVIDKTGGWVLRVMPAGRWLAHGLPFFAAACLVSRVLLPPRQWRGFVLGYTGHLVADLYWGLKVPWLAPFEKPLKSRRPRFSLPANAAAEVAGALFLWRKLSSSSRPNPQPHKPTSNLLQCPID